jgi:hypothetical protein
MKTFLTLLCFIAATNTFSSGTDLLLKQEGSDIDLASTVVVQKQLNLDNPFLIQLYGSYRTLGSLSKNEDAWINLIFEKKHEKALSYLKNIKNPRLAQVKNGAELYLLYEIGLFQNFLARFIDISAKSTFMKTEMGIALDQMIGKDTSSILVNYGFTFNEEQEKSLATTKDLASRINYSLQAFRALRDGRGALPWISKLGAQDILRIRLAQSALLEFARDGKLAASAKLIKEVIEPYVEQSTEKEEVALYYVTLARLLYQAGALAESKEYYYSIPQSSKYFLSARSEALWILLKEKDYAKAKGEVASLKLSTFGDRFHPEVYLVSSMANVLMCQFTDAKNAFNEFVSANQVWRVKIEKQLASKEPTVALLDRTISNLDLLLVSLEEERMLMERTVDLPEYRSYLNNVNKTALISRNNEVRRQWLNRQQLLTDTVYKMGFVKVEFIGRMRELKLARRDQFVDHVSTYQAGVAKSNEIRFPDDGMPWGDDLFHMSVNVINQCMKKFEKGNAK